MRAINHLRLWLVGSASAVALAALTSGPAMAQTVAAPDINPISPVDVSGTAGSLLPGNGSLNAIINDQGIAQADGGDGVDPGSSVNVIAVDNVLPLSAVVGVSLPSAFQQNDNVIFAFGNANVAESRIGVLPGPGGTGSTIDGAVILSMQAADAVDLYVESSGSDITGTVTGDGTASASFSRNAVTVRGNFNRALSTIETVAYADLFVPTDNGELSFALGPTSPVQIGSLSVMNVQLNHGFDADTTDGASNGPIALAEDSSLLFTRDVAPGATIAGAYDLSSNSVLAQAGGNLSDNSILLRREIDFINDNGTPGDTSDDFADSIAGTALFEGTAVVTSIQGSADTVDKPIPSAEDGVGIDSRVDGATLQFLFTQGAYGGTVGTANGLDVTVGGNEIAALTTLNGARNQVFFDGGIALDGPPTTLTATDHVAEFALDLPVRTLANYQANNIQLAGSLDDDPQNAQTADARVSNASMVLGIEDAAAMTVAFDGNSIGAGASGNEAFNLVGNGVDEATTSIVGTSASTNLQFVFEPEVDALIAPQGPVQIIAQVGFDDATDTSFGGFLGTSLSFQGNEVSAQSAGNAFASDTRFTAGSLEMSITDGVANAAGAVQLHQGQATLAVDAGAVTSSVQILDGREPDFDVLDPSLNAFVNGAHLGVFVNDPMAPAAAGLAGATLVVAGNAIETSAAGNSFSSVTALGTAGEVVTTSFTGSTATAVSQFSQGQRVVANTVGDLRVRLGTGTPPADLRVSVEDNSLAALSQGNASATTILLSAQSVTGGADLDDANAVIGSSTALGGLTLGSNTLEADAAALALSNQFNHQGQVSALTVASVVELTIGDGGAGLDLGDSVIAVTGNELVATAQGNFASNGIGISALSATTVRDGGLAGIVSQQQNAVEELGPGSPQYLAIANADQLQVNLMDMVGSSATVSDNRIAADLAINKVENLIVAEVQSLDLQDGTPGTVIVSNPAGEDVDLFVATSGFFIANSQRNEALVPYGDAQGPLPTEPGAGSGAVVQFSSIATTVGSVGGGQSGLSLASDGNAIESSQRANDATNQIAIAGQSGFVDAGILNHQVNSGSLGFEFSGIAAVTDVAITTTLQGAVNSDVAVQMLGNRIVSSITGNNATNTLSAAMETGFSGVAAGGASIASSSLVTAPGSITAEGNLVVLNTQISYGVVDDQGAVVPQILDANLGNATIALNAAGDTSGGSYRLEGNAIGTSATANSASNAVFASTEVGDLPSATIANHQQSSGISVAASTGGATISMTLGGLSGGSASLSGNQIGSAGTINNATNTISAPGQVFTRTSSF